MAFPWTLQPLIDSSIVSRSPFTSSASGLLVSRHRMVICGGSAGGASMLHHVIAMGAGREAADLLLTNARLVNVFSGDIETTHVAVGHGVIVGIGREYRRASQAYDLAGKYLLPGLIDGHVHLESSLLSPARYAE